MSKTLPRKSNLIRSCPAGLQVRRQLECRRALLKSSGTLRDILPGHEPADSKDATVVERTGARTLSDVFVFSTVAAAHARTDAPLGSRCFGDCSARAGCGGVGVCDHAGAHACPAASATAHVRDAADSRCVETACQRRRTPVSGGD